MQKRTQIILDWHNYGFTIMEANGVNGLLVFFAKLYEKFLGKIGDQHLTVS
jgi:hypothetical protein